MAFGRKRFGPGNPPDKLDRLRNEILKDTGQPTARVMRAFDSLMRQGEAGAEPPAGTRGAPATGQKKTPPPR